MEQYLIDDPRPPVFYLRPFKLDYSIFVRNGVGYSFERYFCEVLTKLIGPLVALGNPEDYIPPARGGAVRMYASDTDWVQKLDELARQACCIIVEITSSDNLRLEYTHLKREGLQEKLLVFTGHPNRLPNWLRLFQRMRFGPAYTKRFRAI